MRISNKNKTNYFQAHHAKMLSFAACAGCIIMSIPPIMIGAIARATDWQNTTWSYQGSTLTPEDCEQQSKILPLVLQERWNFKSFAGMKILKIVILPIKRIFYYQNILSRVLITYCINRIIRKQLWRIDF